MRTRFGLLLSALLCLGLATGTTAASPAGGGATDPLTIVVSNDEVNLYVQFNPPDEAYDFGYFSLYLDYMSGYFETFGYYSITEGQLVADRPADLPQNIEFSDAGNAVLITVPRDILSSADVLIDAVITSFDFGSASYFGWITFSDNLAPEISGLTATPDMLWPPNGKAVPVTLAFTASDPEGGDLTVTYTVEDEYGSEDVDGAILPENGVISLIAARNGSDRDGRNYTITVTVTDPEMASASASVVVTVPHDKGK